MITPMVSSRLHALTLTPFFPSDENEVSGCFVAEPIPQLTQFYVDSSIIAVSPLHHSRKFPTVAAPADWVRFPQIPGVRGLSSAGKLLFLRLLKRIHRLHRLHPIDVIHAHAALPCGHAAALLSKHLKIPFVVTVHGRDVFNTCYGSGTSAARRRKVSEYVYHSAQSVICISEKVQAILKTGATGGVRSTVLPNGVDPDLFSPSRSLSGNPYFEILVVGSLLPSKGHEVVLQAVASLHRTWPGLTCRIIGEGPYRAQFENLSRRLGIAEQIRFVGRQSRAEVAAAMQHCSVFVLPSRNEALGCVYLEAMSCGKPVVGCQDQGIDEVIEHGRNGWLIPAEGVDELKHALTTLRRSPEISASMGMAARQTVVEKFTLRHQAQNLAKIYRDATT